MPLSDKPPVLIYQMGKVGSISILQALRRAHIPAYQIHCLEPHRLSTIADKLIQAGVGLPKHIKHSLMVRQNYLEGGVKMKVICPIRHPLHRNISAFFQELPMKCITDDVFKKHLTLPKRIRHAAKLPIPHEFMSMWVQTWLPKTLDGQCDTLQQLFINQYNHRTPLDWLTKELASTFSLDHEEIYQTIPANYRTIHTDLAEILIFRSELSDDDKSLVLNHFLQSDDIHIGRQNRTDQKTIQPIKNEFQQTLSLPTNILAQYRDSIYMQTFYPGDRIV